MKRTNRTGIAEETLGIIEAGYYLPLGGAQKIPIQDHADACNSNTRYFSPEDLDAIKTKVLQSPRGTNATTRIELRNETTLEGARRLADTKSFQRIAALNFASARNPGGGFLGGAQAQEESLARSSALYPSLLLAREFYDSHRRSASLLYSDRMILSPDCVVFRDDQGELLSEPYLLTFITSAAPNAGAITQNRTEALREIPAVFRERAAKVLALAVETGVDVLVLGAWGCGVFRNDPRLVARIFAELLQKDGPFAGRIPCVLFSVLDTSDSKPIYTAFEREFDVR